MSVDSLPFQQVDKPLQENLRVLHIPRITKWLLGSDDTGILALVSNSNWEAALSVEFLLWARELFQGCGEQDKICKEIHSRVGGITNCLLRNAEMPDPDYGDMYCWESVTWDTSVVVRALMMMLRYFPGEFADEKRQEIENKVIGAVQWLAMRFDIWEAEVKFPFGVCDVAQILITLIYLRAEHPDLLEKCYSTGYLKKKPREENLETEILRYLLKEASSENVSERRPYTTVITEHELVYCWENFFTTAEVLEALATASAASLKGQRCQEKPVAGILDGIISEGDAQKARAAAVAAFRYLETHQVNGEWGTHVDTIRCLYAYVKSTFLLGEQPEPHIVFRALRWACDSKQAFSDGSFLHTMFLTVFYALSLREICDHWKPAKRTVKELYDDVVWASPARTTAERGLRLRAEMKCDE